MMKAALVACLTVGAFAATLQGVIPRYGVDRIAVSDVRGAAPSNSTHVRLLPPKQSNLTSVSFEHPLDTSRTLTHVESNTSLSDGSGSVVGVGKKLGPCCDDVDCSPGTPEYIDCDAALDCSVAVCPPLEKGEPTFGRLMSIFGVDVDEDECNNRAPYGQTCTCTCRCVCLYATGEVVWLEW